MTTGFSLVLKEATETYRQAAFETCCRQIPIRPSKEEIDYLVLRESLELTLKNHNDVSN